MTRDTSALRIAATAAALIAAPIYLLTMARQVGFVDRGEMAAVAATLGIAHPTGYPTLTLLGHLATRALPAHPLLALNALAALLVAASAAALTVLFERWMRALENAGAPALHDAPRALLALLSALGLALSATWWQQANGFEAYALHALTLPLTLGAGLAWCGVGATGDEPPFETRRGLWFGLVLGLGFTAHMTVGLLGPALLLLAFRHAELRRTPQRLLPVLGGLLVGLTPYLYLPLRAAQHPRFDWGDPRTLGRFIDHVSGKEFRAWMWSDPHTYERQLGYFGARVPWDLAWIGVPLALVGWIVLWRRERMLAIATLLIGAAGLLYAGGYQIRDIDSYFMTTLLALGLAAAAGVYAVAARWNMTVATLVAVAWVSLAFGLHWQSCNESRNTMARDLAVDLLTPLPENSVVWTSQWDYGLSASYWLQDVAGLRRDVTVVSPALTRDAWYLDELARRAPFLCVPPTPEVARFRALLAARASGDSLGVAHADALRSLITRGAARPSFVTGEVSSEFTPGFERVPIGLARLLVRDTAYVAARPYRFQFRSWRNRVDAYFATSHWIYGEALVARAGYELAHGRPNTAHDWAVAASAFDPHLAPRDVGPQPFDGRELMLQCIGFFAELDLALRAPAPADSTR